MNSSARTEYQIVKTRLSNGTRTVLETSEDFQDMVSKLELYQKTLHIYSFEIERVIRVTITEVVYS